jgi:hypothetical protein
MSVSNSLAELESRLALPPAPGAIGFVGSEVPIDVLLATGRSFGHLPWRASGATPWAERWLESSFPFWARSILEQWHEGTFDALEAVVFSRADDASQRLYYYVRELRQRGALGGPRPLVFDFALLPRESSVAHTAAAVGSLASALGVGSHALEGGIERANELRYSLDELQRRRAAHGPLYERLARAALWSDPTAWIASLALPEDSAAAARVLLAGSMPPDDRLHEAAEAGGASVVAEAHAHALGRLGPKVVVGNDSPERAVARHLMQASVGPRAVLDRAAWIVMQANAARAAAVVLWLTREDEALAWHVPAQRRALAAAGIPALVLPAARWQADDGTLENIAAFCRGLDHATA